ncbi:MAG: hypothetical protein QOF76_1387 [Solirubrobacteraceae bacterium]|nr:hypothetical protein [Solirubrobacteraceae bacterium]
MRRLICLALAVFLLAPATASALPPIKHVWVIQLENHSYDQTFNDQTHPYLWTKVRMMGQVLPQYYATGHASLDNYIAQISGQAPNIMTMADCPIFADFLGAIGPTLGQAVGQGCVYPAGVRTLADQLEDAGLSWKGYMEDMGNDPAREPATCGAPEIGKSDPTQAATAVDQYAARHNPFVYFHSILDPAGRCAAHVGPLPPLSSDLAKIATTPNFSWITPNLCNDGHDATPCAGMNAKGTREGDLIAADAFLAKWVPVIVESPAFKKDGLLIITLDESSINDSTACCGEPTGFNTPFPGISGPGGGRIGTVMMSPYIKPGSTNNTQYNHYSFLRSMEDLFGISEHLGYAGLDAQPAFGDDVYNRPEGGTVPDTPPLPPGDGGSTGTVRRLHIRIHAKLPKHLAGLRHGLRARVRLTGTDRLLTAVQLRIRRGRHVVASSGMARTLPDGRDRLRARLRKHVTLKPGRYVIEARAVHEGKVVAVARRRAHIRR